MRFVLGSRVGEIFCFAEDLRKLFRGLIPVLANLHIVGTFLRFADVHGG